MYDLVEEMEELKAKITAQDKKILDLQRESNTYRKLLNSAATLLDDAENRISELLFLLKQAQGYLPYDKDNLYKQINQVKSFSSVEENLPLLRNEIDSTLESFEIEGISIGTWDEEKL
jgi:chromosome segregation ATPase